MPVDWIIAAPTPWRTLKTITPKSEADEPASTAPTVNMAKPMVYTRLRPTMSESRPIGNSNDPVVRMYPSTTHWTRGIVASKWSAILGRARLTAVWSTTETKVPTEMTAKTTHLYSSRVGTRECSFKSGAAHETMNRG